MRQYMYDAKIRNISARIFGNEKYNTRFECCNQCRE